MWREIERRRMAGEVRLRKGRRMKRVGGGADCGADEGGGECG
jgi:hypothetical protein